MNLSEFAILAAGEGENMRGRVILLGTGMLAAGGFALCVAGNRSAAGRSNPPSVAVSVAANSDQWGSVTGRVVFAGNELPALPAKEVTADKDHCLKEGPIADERWVVNAKNRGVQNAVVFLKFDKDEELAIHPDLEKPAASEVVLDQPFCRFSPHVVAMRHDQKLRVKNPAPIAHNVKIQGFVVDENRQLAPGKDAVFAIKAEDNPIAISCGAHPWMGAYLWVFEHPYFAVTDADGRFAIAKAPAGRRKLMVWHEEIGYVDRGGTAVAIKANGALDVGTFEVKPRKK